ncbi:MAG: ABC transporter permease [Clostridium sp.]|nr:ABC transporter permease [Acetatifactor muris]MCM1527566.1 ABC transporter permease [Bacteroides sp.]MCM1563808.1 ABC transporter permease [Clostridium sp.]
MAQEKRLAQLQKRPRNPYLWVGLFMMVTAVLPAVVGIFWTPYSTTAMSAAERFQAPSLRHLFGTDNFGRDIFSRVMQGAGTTIFISSLVVLISGGMGILIGALTGYFGGIADEIVMRFTDAVNGFPSILLALVMISILGSGKQNLILSLGIVFTPSFVRIVRSEFIRLRDMDYISRARLMGVGRLRILFVHILPNILSTFWVSVMIGFNNGILAESGMSYLGIGVRPPDASLGEMLSDAQGYLMKAPWYALAPGLTIVWIVLGFSFLGEGIRRNGDIRQDGSIAQNESITQRAREVSDEE